MDWSKLRCLDLDGGAPRYLLGALTGYFQHLEVLKFGLKLTHEARELWTCQDLGFVRRFLGHVDELEELHVQAATGS